MKMTQPPRLFPSSSSLFFQFAYRARFSLAFICWALNWKGTSFGKLFNSRRGSRIDTDRFPTER